MNVFEINKERRALFNSDKWDNVFKNGPVEICGRQPLKKFI